MTPRRYQTRSEGYGVTVEVTVEHAAVCTTQELDRALRIAAAEVLARHEEPAR